MTKYIALPGLTQSHGHPAWLFPFEVIHHITFAVSMLQNGR